MRLDFQSTTLIERCSICTGIILNRAFILEHTSPHQPLIATLTMADNGVDTGDSQPPADKTQINESHDAAENNPPKDAPFPKGTEGFVVDHSGATDDFCNEAGEKNDNDTSVNVNNGDPDSIGGEDPKKGGKRKEAKSITRTRYSNDFKVKVLDELAVSNYTVAEMARRHKLPEATVRFRFCLCQ